jgi:hypothetical protein
VSDHVVTGILQYGALVNALVSLTLYLHFLQMVRGSCGQLFSDRKMLAIQGISIRSLIMTVGKIDTVYV